MSITSIVVAASENNAIGKNNDLIWHLPNDLKRFKSITSGHKVIMGRKTFLSLPGGPLKNRTNIILTKNPSFQHSGCIIAGSVEEAIELSKNDPERFILGGEKIYKAFLPITDKIYLTRVHARFEADTFFPDISMNDWEETENIHFQQDEKHAFSYSFITLKRKKP